MTREVEGRACDYCGKPRDNTHDTLACSDIIAQIADANNRVSRDWKGWAERREKELYAEIRALTAQNERLRSDLLAHKAEHRSICGKECRVCNAAASLASCREALQKFGCHAFGPAGCRTLTQQSRSDRTARWMDGDEATCNCGLAATLADPGRK
jgi:hypothetical protein